MAKLIEFGGVQLDAAELSIRWAAAFARYLQADENGAFELRECRRASGGEVVVLLVRPEVPQRPHYDIRYEEPLAVFFPAEGEHLPQVLALRSDFPEVPHLNLQRKAAPKNLCLFAERPEELVLKWTPALLGDRILWWLRETARGALHHQDQVLEPFFGGIPRPLIVPPDIFSAGMKEILQVYYAPVGDGREVLLADRPGTAPAVVTPLDFCLLAFELPLQEAGVINVEPETLQGLHDLCQAAGYDLLGEVRAALREGAERVRRGPKGTILMLQIPKRRDSAAEVESTDLFGFRCRIATPQGPVDLGPGKLGELLGVLTPGPRVHGADPQYVPLIGSAGATKTAAAGVYVELLTPQRVLTPEIAAVLSGSEGRKTPRILAVGQGALGSQIFANLARQGYGQWTLVDGDYYAPHNAVRHALLGKRYGLAKAVQMATLANEMYAGPPIARGIVADVLSPGARSAEIEEEAQSADLILDMSVSVPVSRHLALDMGSDASRMATFLNPSGLDMVVMWEGAARAVPLDVIESQYYRAAVNDERLTGHLEAGRGPIRYGGTCRDLSSRISQETVALHAAIGASTVREAGERHEPLLSIWRCERNRMTVARYDLAVEAAIEEQALDWTIVTDEGLRRKVMRLRSEKLPKETCGVLLGYHDTQRQRIYLVDALPAPPDSVEDEDGCTRGVSGLEDAVRSAFERTMHQVDYVGEWHSHPDGEPGLPSVRDLRQMGWVKSRMHPEGKPALIMITCEGDMLTFLVVEP